MDRNILIFFEDKTLRIKIVDYVIWFMVNDIAHILGIQNASRMAINVEYQQRSLFKTHTNGGRQKMLYITEFGVYSILRRSKKPISHKVFLWFAKKIIPKLALEQYNIPFPEHEKYKERVEKGILKYYKELEFTRAFHRNR